ncbi:MAG: prepilin peptidase [Pseudomonadota bacterium]
MSSELVFLVVTAPICIWVAANDMKFMKIPNVAVVSLALIYIVVGPLVMPLGDYGRQLLHLPIVLLIGFILNMAGVIGAGDAKFAAAMAPFIAAAHAVDALFIFAAVVLAAFATHRVARATPAIRSVAADWESWRSKKFPMGLALGPTLSFYFIIVMWLDL